MLIADSAIREEGTRKTSLIGIFQNIGARQFPVRHSSLVVYVKMTDAEGHYLFRLQLVRLEDEAAIGDGSIEADVADRLSSGEAVFQLAGLVFDRPGRYEFRLYANGRYVGGYVFNVLQRS